MKKTFNASLYLALSQAGGEIINKDEEGEEYILFGISRRKHPFWTGWNKVDGLKVTRRFTLEDAKEVCYKDISKWYKDNFWDKIGGDDLPVGVDLFMFDTAISTGPDMANLILEEAVKNASEPSVVSLDRCLKRRLYHIALRSKEFIIDKGYAQICRAFTAHSVAIGEL